MDKFDLAIIHTKGFGEGVLGDNYVGNYGK